MLFVNRKRSFPPATPSRNVVFLLVPLVFAVNFESGRINHHKATRFHRFAQHMSGQFDTVFGNAAKVRNADVRFQDQCQRNHEPFGLAQWPMKNLTDQHRRFNRHIRILLRPTPCACLGRTPPRYGFFSEPDRDISTPTQGRVVVGPVGHLIVGFDELVAAILVRFVRHRLSLVVKSTRIMPAYRP